MRNGSNLPSILRGLIVLGFISGPLMSPAKAVSNSPNSFGIPIITTTPDNTRYQNDPNILNECTKRVTAIKGQPCDLIFIGDSITEHWFGAGQKVWINNYAKRNALNFAITGDQIQNVLWRLDNMDIKDLKPKAAIILLGTNNLENTAKDIAAGVKAVYDKTLQLFPDIKIIGISLPPNGEENDKTLAANDIIKTFADDQSVYYVDLVPLMTPTPVPAANGKTTTTWKGLASDQVHFDADGYQIWADALNPVLDKIVPPPAPTPAPVTTTTNATTTTTTVTVESPSP